MDALLEHSPVLDETLVQAVTPLLDEHLSLVPCDRAIIRTEGLSEQVSDIRQVRMAKEDLIAR
jgi:hypothetical protein